MTETVTAFFFVALRINTDRKASRRLIAAVQLLCITVTAISLALMLLLPETGLDIKLFTVYAMCLGVVGFAMAGKNAVSRKDPGSRLILTSLLPLIPAAYFQIERKTVLHIVWDWNYNAITHIFIIVCEFIFFFAAMHRLKSK